MDEPNRSIAKRQIARLLGSSTIPFCVLSEDNVLVFANESMGQFVGLPAEALLGLKCDSELPTDGSAASPVSAFFALPSLWSRQVIKLIPETGSPPIVSESPNCESYPRQQTNSIEANWIRCLIPLEENGCVLCAFCPSWDWELHDVIDEQTANIQRILRTNRERYKYLDGMWYLQGGSAGTRRALEQVQIAIANPLPLTVFGTPGTGRSWLAESIQSQRRKLADSGKVSIGDAWIRIDCKLMDVDLLPSILEAIDEAKVQEKVPATVFLDNLECLANECIFILVSFLKSHLQTVLIATCDPMAISNLKHSNTLWSELLSRAGVLRVDLPELVDRLEDIPTLINAWFASHPSGSSSHAVEICSTFLDAVVAYPWPGGVEEFSETLAYASKNAYDDKLTEKSLPVNIRTCVSHIEQTHQDESVDLDSILEDVERTMIMRALERFPQNKTSAAKILNISRARLLRRLQQWGIHAENASVDGDEDLPDFSEIK